MTQTTAITYGANPLIDPDARMTPHAQPAKAVVSAFESTADGLSTQEASRRLAVHGPNRLPRSVRRSALLGFLAQFHNVLIYALILSAIVTAALGHWVDTGVILAVVMINAVIGYVQEGRAQQAMEAIRDMLAPHAEVLRDGRRIRLAADGVVPGDIVLVTAGDRVPADLRLIQARALKADEAILTGESVPVDKRTTPVPLDAALGDQVSMLFSGTFVATGTGRGVVVATGPQTQIGAISGLLSRVETLTTPLVAQMDSFARWLTLFILIVGAALFAYGYFVSHLPFADVFMMVVVLAVAAIPEGLPALLTVTLAVSVQSMARRNAIIRQLPAVETLGAVSVICSDKTGTLTRNEMMVTSLAGADVLFGVSGTGYAPHGTLQDGTDVATAARHPVLTEFAQAALLCNDARLAPHGSHWQVEGDPMEGALLALAGKIIGTAPAALPDWSRLDVIPFDAAHRYMATLSHAPDGRVVIFVKGAPEAVLSLCDGERAPRGGKAPLRADHWHRMVDALAADGQRVIAVARRDMPQGHSDLSDADLQGKLTLIGLIGLIDPPRDEAIAAIAQCHSAGIRVKMITGDHAATARAIAQQIGLKNTHSVLTGSDLDRMDDAELAQAAVQTDIFARTSPAHKLRLVTALQSQGLTVAMTGDGVNDAPALKRADAGIAMGKKGSAAAREAASIVLADDNFASIAAAVREGRTVHDNITKVISWMLPTNGGEAMTIVLALALGMALPILPIQILWTNMITAITLGFALAFEPTEPGSMQRPPRNRQTPILTGPLLWHITLVMGLFLAGVYGIYAYALDRGHELDVARSMALNTLVVLKIFHLIFIRNLYGTSLNWSRLRGTRVLWLCIATALAAQFALTYFPPLQRIFSTAAIPLTDGLVILGVGIVFFALIETEKQMRRALGASGQGA